MDQVIAADSCVPREEAGVRFFSVGKCDASDEVSPRASVEALHSQLLSHLGKNMYLASCTG